MRTPIGKSKIIKLGNGTAATLNKEVPKSIFPFNSKCQLFFEQKEDGEELIIKRIVKSEVAS